MTVFTPFPAGDAYRQEHYAPGEALDQARVLPRLARMTVLYGTFRHVLVTSERSPLEPHTEDKSFVAAWARSPSAWSRAATRPSSW